MVADMCMPVSSVCLCLACLCACACSICMPMPTLYIHSPPCLCYYSGFISVCPCPPHIYSHVCIVCLSWVSKHVPTVCPCQLMPALATQAYFICVPCSVCLRVPCPVCVSMPASSVCSCSYSCTFIMGLPAPWSAWLSAPNLVSPEEAWAYFPGSNGTLTKSPSLQLEPGELEAQEPRGLVRQSVELRRQLQEEQASYRRKLQAYQEGQQRQAQLVQRLQAKVRATQPQPCPHSASPGPHPWPHTASYMFLDPAVQEAMLGAGEAAAGQVHRARAAATEGGF